MKLRGESVLRVLLALGLIAAVGTLPGLTETARAHGPLTGRGYVEEEKKGPHGGQVTEFGKNYLEFTVDRESGEIALFLLDKDLKPVSVPEGYSGMMYIHMDDGGEWFNLRREAGDPVPHLKAETGIEEIGPFNALVGLKTGEERENFRFSWTPTSHAHDAESMGKWR